MFQSAFIMMLTSALSVLGLLVSETLAHGAVTSYRIAGTTYPGYVVLLDTPHRSRQAVLAI